tara:strand:+ start:5282 stop:5746 length:465 start_codon:yes stop_codon:yes gene_type:complete
MFGLKRSLLRWCGAELGVNVRISSSARFQTNGPLRIGAETWIGHQVLITGGTAPIEIGQWVDIAPRVLIVSGSHHPTPGAEKAAGAGVSVPVRIHDGAWIGAGATILGGAEIGASSVVAAGALVRGVLAGGGVYGGIPARALRDSEKGGTEQCE